jgi:hypothetical protein
MFINMKEAVKHKVTLCLEFVRNCIILIYFHYIQVFTMSKEDFVFKNTKEMYYILA